jgi:hypothetical protein
MFSGRAILGTSASALKEEQAEVGNRSAGAGGNFRVRHTFFRTRVDGICRASALAGLDLGLAAG